MGTVSVPLTQGKFALIDEEDAERVLKHRWHAILDKRKWYAGTDIGEAGRLRTVRLHRFILDAPDGVLVDHRDGDGLNCVRDNLRLANHKQNAHNRQPYANGTGLKGVTFSKTKGCWTAQIGADGHQQHLGQYATSQAAALAYDRAARGAYGEFAWLNFPERTNLPDEPDGRLHREIPRGERHHNARLDESAVQEIRRSAAQGESITSLSRRFRVTRRSIQQVIRRVTWRHVA